MTDVLWIIHGVLLLGMSGYIVYRDDRQGWDTWQILTLMVLAWGSWVLMMEYA